MNRRELFKFASAAAIALPAIAKAAVTPALEVGSLGSIEFVGIDGAAGGYYEETYRRALEAMKRGFISVNEARGMGCLPAARDTDPCVEQQMIEHDLFDIGT